MTNVLDNFIGILELPFGVKLIRMRPRQSSIISVARLPRRTAQRSPPVHASALPAYPVGTTTADSAL